MQPEGHFRILKLGGWTRANSSPYLTSPPFLSPNLSPILASLIPPSFPPLPLEVDPLIRLGGSGGALKLHQRGLERAPAEIEFGAF